MPTPLGRLTRLPREPELGVEVAVLGVLVDGQRLRQAKVGLRVMVGRGQGGGAVGAEAGRHTETHACFSGQRCACECILQVSTRRKRTADTTAEAAAACPHSSASPA